MKTWQKIAGAASIFAVGAVFGGAPKDSIVNLLITDKAQAAHACITDGFADTLAAKYNVPNRGDMKSSKVLKHVVEKTSFIDHSIRTVNADRERVRIRAKVYDYSAKQQEAQAYSLAVYFNNGSFDNAFFMGFNNEVPDADQTYLSTQANHVVQDCAAKYGFNA